MAVVEPRRSQGGRLEGPRPLVVGLVELEGDLGMVGLEAAHEGDEGVLVVEVVVGRAVGPGLEVELELLDVQLGDGPVDDRGQVVLEGGVGCVPHAEAGIVGDLGGDVPRGGARPVGVGGIGLAGLVELDRRHPQPEADAEGVELVDEVGRAVAVGVRKAHGVEAPVARLPARPALPLVVQHQRLEPERLPGPGLGEHGRGVEVGPVAPRVERVEAHGAHVLRGDVGGEVLDEGGGRLLGTAVVDAGVGPSQLEGAQRQHGALAHRRRVGGILDPVVVGGVGEDGAGVQQVACVVDAGPQSPDGRVPAHPAHGAAAALAHDEGALAAPVVGAHDLALLVEGPRRLGDDPVVVAPVGSAVVGVHLGDRRLARRPRQLVQ